MKKKLRSSLSLLLSFVMVFSVFTIVPITASAAETYERLSFIDVTPNDVFGEHFTAHANYKSSGDEAGWCLDCDYPDNEYIDLSATDGTTINKLVLHANYPSGLPAVSVNGRGDLSYTKTSDDNGWNSDYTFENVNATTVRIYSAPTEDYYFYLAWADVYYGTPRSHHLHRHMEERRHRSQNRHG